MILDVKQY